MSGRVRKLTETAVFAALLLALSPLSIPLPSGIPLTLQTFLLALCGAVLGSRHGTAAYAVYLALGAVGLPVFSGFQGGFGVLLGLTGGYLWGFFPLVILNGIRTDRRVFPYVLGLLGLLVCHLFGVLQFAAVAGNTVSAAFWVSSAPYLVKDMLFVGLAQALRRPLRRALRKAGKH